VREFEHDFPQVQSGTAHVIVGVTALMCIAFMGGTAYQKSV